MKRQELIVLLMIAEGSGDDLFQFMKLEDVCTVHDALVKMELLEPPGHPAVISMKVTDRARLYLSAVDMLPLPQKVWSMNQVCGE